MKELICGLMLLLCACQARQTVIVTPKVVPMFDQERDLRDRIAQEDGVSAVRSLGDSQAVEMDLTAEGIVKMRATGAFDVEDNSATTQ